MPFSEFGVNTPGLPEALWPLGRQGLGAHRPEPRGSGRGTNGVSPNGHTRRRAGQCRHGGGEVSVGLSTG